MKHKDKNHTKLLNHHFVTSDLLSHTEQQGHSSQNPFGGPLPGFKTQRPHISGSSDLGLVEWTLINISGLLTVIGHSSD